MMNSRILSTGSYLPSHIRTNADLEKMVDTSDEWIVTRSGIRERRIAAADETVATMGCEAAKKALEMANLDPQEIELIIVATTSGSHAYPSSACQVQGLLGIEDAISFDLAAACTGFVYALGVADKFIRSGSVKKALVIGADLNSRKLDETDRSTVVLFGDGAGAVVLEAEENAVYIQAVHSIGSRGEALTCVSRNQQQFIEKDADISSTYMQMDGKEVFKFAVSKVPEVIMEVLEKAGKTKEEIRFYMLHQANKRIVASVSKHMNEPLEKYPMNIENLGNTSSASIPLLLDEWNKKGRLNSGDWIILSGFGGGLTYGASLLQW